MHGQRAPPSMTVRCDLVPEQPACLSPADAVSVRGRRQPCLRPSLGLVI